MEPNKVYMPSYVQINVADDNDDKVRALLFVRIYI